MFSHIMKILLFIVLAYSLEEVVFDKWKQDSEAIVIFYASWW